MLCLAHILLLLIRWHRRLSFGGITSGSTISSGATLEVTFSESVKSGTTLIAGEITATGNAVTVGPPALKSGSTTVFDCADNCFGQ